MLWLNGKSIKPNKRKTIEKPNTNNSLKFIDLFCGLGGFRLAAENNGMDCVFSSDNDKFVQATYEHWYGDKPYGDVTEFTKNTNQLNKIPDFDVLFAGFPCQPFSYAGRNEGFEDKTRGTLFFHVAKILSHHMPKALILENVKGLKSHNKGETLKTIRDSLHEIGYTLFDDIINSYHFNIPQYRERWFCVGIRNDLITKESKSFQLNTGNKSKKTTLKTILDMQDNSNPHLEIKSAEKQKIKFHFDNMKNYSNGRVKHDNSRYEAHTKKGRHGVFSYLKPDKTLRFHIGDIAKTQIQESYYVHSDTYAPAIIANRRPKLWDIQRFLSVKECLRLQAYPDHLEFPVSDAQAYKQLGNSVCVAVVDSVVKDMLTLLELSNEKINSNGN
ncbi:DNA cytosine methyltransferase [Colwellia echini]|uniref:Cytosine-specific methyltransferase n=2 Tax=Colwellia echini TaxID=1982103 RepID=A0ABY3MY42_9GAMM|nr:DNA cytosine methyltransferase [Colwellia echini]